MKQCLKNTMGLVLFNYLILSNSFADVIMYEEQIKGHGFHTVDTFSSLYTLIIWVFIILVIIKIIRLALNSKKDELKKSDKALTIAIIAFAICLVVLPFARGILE